MYIAAYGKDFPDPYHLMWNTMRPDGNRKKLTPEQWKETRAFIIKEVSWQVAGFDLNKQEKIGERVANVLDRAYAMSDEELKKEFNRAGAGLRGELSDIKNQAGGPTNVLKHVLEQDLAELLANPRLMAAVKAREQYLKTAGIVVP
jgi:hypothetical protein